MVGTSLPGIDFASPDNPCGCLPPDTNAAVGPNQVVETVNEEIRAWDKTTGAVVFDSSLTSFFGQGNGGDVYVLYDNTADRCTSRPSTAPTPGCSWPSRKTPTSSMVLPTYNLDVPAGPVSALSEAGVQ